MTHHRQRNVRHATQSVEQCVPTRSVGTRTCRSRRGLAPLEFVLALPILLFVMALFVDFGNLASWKVRGATVARQAVWRQRWPRHGATDPQPAGWPAPATLGTAAATPPIFTGDPFANHPVIRGPTINVPKSDKFFIVDRSRVDISSDLKKGRSHVDVRLPMLPRLMRASYDLEHQLLDSRWQFGNMGLPDNLTRRTLYLYAYVRTPELLTLAQAYQSAAQAILQAPFRPQLATLDRDDELPGPPDFHRHLLRVNGCREPISNCCNHKCCDADPVRVRQQLVTTLVTSIQGPRGGGQGGVPDRMAGAFLALYQRQIQQLRQQMPPPQGQISALQAKIDQLNAFRATLN